MTAAVAQTKRTQRRVAFATLIGTTVEWYDYFIYATIAGLVFAKLFFEPAGPQVGQLLAFATVGISFLFRPIGAFLAGHFGDRIGRRAMLILTLLLMGFATMLIGFLPTYETAGALAPILLIILRVVQGISAGGEWGGAVLMAVEHADPKARGRAGSFPQLGVPLGLLLASGVSALMTGVISPGAAFEAWGWRVPFLLSIVMIAVGYFVRRSVEESPVFLEIAARKEQPRIPIATLFRKHWILVILAALVFAGNNAAGYMATGGFIPAYATNPKGVVRLDKPSVLLAMTFAAAMWLIFTLLAGYMADSIGRKRTYIIGFIAQALTVFPLFLLINTGHLWALYLALFLFTFGLGLTYGPQAAWYSEIFPASVRFSGVSISYALGAILGGAFAPTIAQALLDKTHTSLSISAYLLCLTLIGLVAALLLKDRAGINLSVTNQAEQEVGATIFDHRQPASPANV